MKPTYLQPTPCRCIKRRDGDEPFGDERDGTCASCGRQVDGKPMPTVPRFSLGVGDDRSSFARSTRKFRPAA